ncbi:hypothetical protein EVAR_84534_1 [Eumeta japonica]|uniref:Endonuclease-reverse transcriptase n=1 Tax=Eumeta variegata TaxID=151549 RepID=A0A4C1UHT0_EUMVA|nr:hypothetical protein EVAR_84534_1 [Eumeta japonica]
MEEKLIPIIEENKILKANVEKLQNEIAYLKKEKRSNNIVIFGLKEGESSASELILKVREVFQIDLQIHIGDSDVNNIYRIGKAIKTNNPRPILLSFTSNLKKSEIMTKRKALKEIYITEDYPKEVLEIRKTLQPKLIEERNKGNLAYIKYNKLVVKESNPKKDKRKRETSTSPQPNIQPRKQQTLTATNRKNAFDVIRARSSSLSARPEIKQ